MTHPNKLPFVAVRATVKQGSEIVARAMSSMMARMIAEALNYWTERKKP